MKIKALVDSIRISHKTTIELKGKSQEELKKLADKFPALFETVEEKKKSKGDSSK